MEMFPDSRHVLHAFSGSLPASQDYTRVDVKLAFDDRESINGDIVGDVEELSSLTTRKFDLVMADPPYTPADAERYGYRMVDRRRALREVAAVMRPGGHCVWLDTVWPMVAKAVLRRVGVISIFRSSNHRVRAAFVFQKP